MLFSLTTEPIVPEQLMPKLEHHGAGACVTFAGWVRNHNDGKEVLALEYEVYRELALKEGERIVQEAVAKFSLYGAIACHRYGRLELGEIAVWVGATSTHRKEAFQGAAYIIDEIKHRLPIWKKEHYKNAPATWVLCCHH
ncbi:MAG: molybdenum cofactor biosynthesis protein MoaE [Pseudanabaenaceae cyanobacterium SKYGB_i_bin29]|nr:molybdenum cofactor biosynthesis protein MoaE [Pseudanabaenaceae cyanobacterium SKYG29]MDW8422015.1 molybdenum cofactor biosynthesis protein MoaE [Pseudanabaenaceae cyanobacterium SKYGB_i_bin29]